MAATKTSSSSSSAPIYEVFLSFRGADTRTGFTDHLYHALVDSGIETFRDDEELRIGEEIGPDLVSAIQHSKISIPIFSKNYASSKWCLIELTQMVECRRTMNQTVLPIFYNVEPSDVRNQTGSYAEAFEKHQMRFDKTKLQKWKEALREVGALKGWELRNIFDGHEGKLIKLVVKKVWIALNKTPLSNFDNLFGIQSHVGEMLRLLNIESGERKIVGIQGIGGIGKTTIAKAVYNKVFHHFEGCSFIADVRETSKKDNGLVHMQNQLVFDILKQKIQKFSSVDDGINVIKQRFCKKKVLIVLDDVDKNIQVNALVQNCKSFGVGSRIIITSRNKDVLVAQEADGIYEPKKMNLDQSLQLFSHHAFRREQPPEDYLDLSIAMVHTTGGLPLALKVIGSSLFRKGESLWQGMLEKLQKVPDNEVMGRLRISYDGLDEEEKHMFLDTACFFIGMNKDIACYIWDGCNFFPKIGLEVLCLRSLLTIDKDDELRMHDLLRDLGREIVRQENITEPWNRSRIWLKEEALDVLDTKMETGKVEGFSIDFGNKRRSQCLMSEGFVAMTKLRLLRVDYARFDETFVHCFSQLRWLSWKGCPEQFTETNSHLRKLAVLDLSDSEITENWMGWNYIKMAANLKYLNLSCTQLSRTPDLSANQCLEVLILNDCKNLAEIDASIGRLKRLVTLDMNGCECLVDLPFEICQLSSLNRLNLKGCKSLNKLPEKMGRMKALEKLHIDLTSVEWLPDSMGDLKNLETFSAQSCVSLSEVGTIQRLSSWECLTRLDLHGCSKLQFLPWLPSSLKFLDASECPAVQSLHMFSNLTNLEELCLEGCKYLVEVPNDIEKLSKLEILKLGGNNFSILPDTVYALTSLKILSLSACKKLQYILYLPSSLTRLDVSGCTFVRYITGLPSSLTILNASRCTSIRYILGLPSSLIRLDVSYCTSVQYILGLPLSLTGLFANYCKSLEKLSATSGLRNLENLHLKGCRSLQEIEGIEGFDSLKRLNIRDCRSLTLQKLLNLSGWKELRQLLLGGSDIVEIWGLEQMDSLEMLKIVDCPSLFIIPKLSSLKKLRTLEIYNCHILSEVEGFERMVSLEMFKIKDCPHLQKITKLSGLKKLRELYIVHCEQYKTGSFQDLESLEKLTIRDCPKIDCLEAENLRILEIKGCMEKLLDLSSLNKLVELCIKGCEEITEIPGLDGLESLRSLRVTQCISIERLPDLSDLTDLNYLYITGCRKLTEIQGVDRLISLEELFIDECVCLEQLPDLSNLKNLQKLKAESCEKLTEIPGVNGLESLEALSVTGCISLEKLPDLSNLKKLQNLSPVSCVKLNEIAGFNGLESLEDLDVSGCESLERLPDLSNLKKLRHLWAASCVKLTEITCVSGLESLECLDVKGCISLTKLQLDFRNLPELEVIEISGCDSLRTIKAPKEWKLSKKDGGKFLVKL